MDFNFLTEQVLTGENQTYLDWIISGALNTIAVSITAFLLSLIIGICMGALRTTTGLKAKLANGYFEVVRSIPFLALLFISFYVVPVTFMPGAMKHFDPTTMILIVGISSLAIFMSARITAQVSAGIQALPKSQSQAAKALGFSQVQTYTRFLIPQALRNIMPTLCSEAMNTVKNSAVVSMIGFMDLTRQAQSIIDYTAKPLEAFTCIVLGYLIINMAVLGVMKFVEMKTRIA